MIHYLRSLLVLSLAVLPAVSGVIRVPEHLPTIQGAIDLATAGDTVLVAGGTYVENISFKGKAITVASHFILDGDSSHIADTVIDGSQAADPDSASVVYFVAGEDTNSVLAGFTITGGSGTQTEPLEFSTVRAGGGIFCWNAGARIVQNDIRNNTVQGAAETVGGGIFAAAEDSTDYVIIADNLIRLNVSNGDSVAAGGGLLVGLNGRVSGNTVSENSCNSRFSSFGGGLSTAIFFLDGSRITIANNQFRGNQSLSFGSGGATGGGLHVVHRQPRVLSNIIRENVVRDNNLSLGAGLFLLAADQGGIVGGNAIMNNSSTNGDCVGGGVAVVSATALTIRENRIISNAGTLGGGLSILESTPAVRNNLIVRNTSVFGGGVWMQNLSEEMNPTLRARLETVLRKQSRYLTHAWDTNPTSKGASYTTATPALINNTIAGNVALLSGGGIDALSSSAEVMNSIIWGNEAPDGAQIDGSVLLSYSDVEGGYSGVGNIDQAPLFVDEVDYHLDPSSPCVDAGNPAAAYEDPEDPANAGTALWPARGSVRNDMGAYGGQPETAKPAGEILGTRLQALLDRLEEVPVQNRQATADSFLATVESFPMIEENTIATFLYRGNASRVNVPGDANNWDGNAFAMSRIDHTNLWYRQEVFEPDARLEYKFVLNGSNWILDPRNPRTALGGFGPNSELAMPEYVDPPETEFYPDILHGTLHDTTIFSPTLGNSRRVRVYTPPGYETAGSDSFGVILFHDGLEFITLAQANNTIDYLISENRIQPIIAVFVPPVNRNDEYAFNRTSQFTTFIVDELMPVIDARYRTKRDPASRAMTGISFGGLITTEICYNRPESFGLCAPYSPSYWAKNMAVFNAVATGPKKELKFYLDWGTYEIGIAINARQMRDELSRRGYESRWNEWHEGHSWGSWRAHLDIALEYFFPATIVSVAENEALPQRFALAQNYPNPFSLRGSLPAHRTWIRYDLPKPANVTLEIYDLLGQKVRTLVNTQESAGRKLVAWDSRDDRGRAVASGVYLYRLEAEGEFVAKRKLTLMK